MGEEKKIPESVDGTDRNPTSELIEDLQNALQTKDIQIKSKDGKIKVLETDVINLKKQLQDIREEFQLENQNKIKNENDLALNVKKESNRGGMVGDLVRELESKISKQKKQITKLRLELEKKIDGTPSTVKKENLENIFVDEQELIEYKDKIKSLEKEKVSLIDEISEKNETIDSLKQEMAEKESSVSKVTKVGSLDDLVADLQRKLGKYKTQNEKFRQQLESYSNLDKISAELKRKNALLGERDDNIHQMNEEIGSFRQKIQMLNSKIEDLTSSEAEKRIIQLEDKFKSISLKNELLNDDKEELENKIALLEEKIEKSNIDNVKDKNSVLVQQNSDLRAKIGSLNTKISMLEEDLKETGARKQMMRVREMKSLLEGMKRRNKEQMLEITDLRRRLADQI